jgi:hypothetical protein
MAAAARLPLKRPMRILTVSDVVVPMLYKEFDAGRFQGIDLVVSCGDLPPEYLSFLVHVLPASVFYVRGNHDIRYLDKPPEGCFDLHGRVVRYRGYRILGLEGSHWYNGGPHQYTEWDMRLQVLRLLPALWLRGGVDLVVTHAPPRHIHDGEDPCHRGFDIYRRLMQWFRPAYFIHGHIHRNFDHPQERVTRFHATTVINTYGYHILDIEDRRPA